MISLENQRTLVSFLMMQIKGWLLSVETIWMFGLGFQIRIIVSMPNVNYEIKWCEY